MHPLDTEKHYATRSEQDSLLDDADIDIPNSFLWWALIISLVVAALKIGACN